ncbi:peptidoglycan-binding domain-containing protein [Streptomyces sp. NPDC001340]
MQQNVLTKALVSAATVFVIAAGSLASAGVSFAAPVPDSKPTASPESVAPLAVENLGLSVPEAKKVQDWLKQWWGYTGEINGQLDTASWKAFQRFLAAYWSYPGEINGKVGSDTVQALQRMLKVQCGYTGKIDGVAGPDTRAAFKRFADK